MWNFLKIKFLLCPSPDLINCVTLVLILVLFQFIDDGEFLFPSQTLSSVLFHTSCCLHYNYSTGRSILRVPCLFWVRDLITHCKMCGGLFGLREVGFLQTLRTLSRGRTVLLICIVISETGIC